MKNLKKYIGLMLTAVAASAGFTSCQDDFDAPDMTVPVATLKPNITIAEFKELYWDNSDNYVRKITPGENGERLVIAGRVISDDADGNIFRSLIIQDETGALSMSVYSYNLYLQYRVGQEVVMDLTDMYAGKYSTIFQLGYPDYSPAYGEQPSFMPRDFFDSHAQLNGMPEISKIDTLVINSFSELSNSQEDMRKFGSQLVRFNNVKFALGGEASFCTAHKVSSTDRVLAEADNEGATIDVRTSGYASFWSTMLPEGAGDVVGIITSYYDSSSKSYAWRLQIRSTSDLLNFGNPTLPKGTEDNPYNVLEGIDMIKAEKTQSGWFTGYIVGSLKAGVQTVTSADDIEWSANAEVNNTLVIGQTAQSNTLDDVMLIRLPQGSDLRTYGNLRDVPENYQKQIWVLATPGTELGMNAFTGNTGAKNEFRIEGVTVPGGDEPGGAVADGDGSEVTPYNPTQVVAMGTNLNQSDKWVKGYIVGYVADKSYSSATNVLPATIASNILLATTPDETDYSKCIPVQLVASTDPRAALNLMDNPGNLGKLCSVHGNLIKYFGVPAIKEVDKCTLEGGTTPTPPTPGDAVTSFDQTFEGSTSIPTGWTNVCTSGNANWFIRNYSNNNSAEVTAYGSNKTPGSDGFVSWLVSPGLNVDGMSQKTLAFQSMCGYQGNGTLEVFALTSADPATATATKLNCTVAQPTGQFTDWVNSGSISLAQFSGTIYIGFRYKADTGSNYTTYRVDNVKAGEGGGGTDPDPGTDPDTPVVGGNSVDFSIFGEAPNNSYIDRSGDGWSAAFCALGIGAETDNVNAMKFSFVPLDKTCIILDGSIAKKGSLTSPTLSGGCSKVSFSYAYPYSEKKAGFTVNVKQNGTVKATKTVTHDTITKLTELTFSMDVTGVSGDFTIEIINDAYSQTASGNKDRTAIWNLSWAN